MEKASAQIQAESISPIKPAVDVVLSIDDGISDVGLGGSGNPGFGWFNLLVPDAYPATIKEVVIAFNPGRRGMASGSPIRILVFSDLEADGPNSFQKPDAIFSVTSNSPGNFERYALQQPITISRGGFVVGALDSIFVAELPALLDQPGKISPAGSRSFFTVDNGQTIQTVSRTFPGFGIAPGSWLVRAVVDIPAPPPVISRAFYRKNKLRIVGRNFAANAIIRINNKRIDKSAKFDSGAGKLIIKGTPEELNINPAGQSNKLVVIVDGIASATFDFTT